MNKREVEAAWKKTQKATDTALNMIRRQLGLMNMDVLWSGSLLVPVIAMCASQSVKELNPRTRGWIALAALARRYSGSAAETALDQDLRACRSPDPLAALLGNLRQLRTLVARPEDFGGAVADRSGLLTMYIACQRDGLLNFDGGKLIMHSDVDRHHILPRGQFSEGERSRSDCIANFAFIEGKYNKSLSLTGPEIYLAKLPKDVLVSQCILENMALWRIS